MHFIIISGQSGAGKSVALHALEDLGYYGVDNLPVRLLPSLVEELHRDDGGGGIERVAAVVDVRSPRHDLTDFDTLFQHLGNMGVDVEVLFLEAEREILLKRFSETRRRHPLTEGEIPLSEALEREAEMLEPLRQRARVFVDTSLMHLHQLRTLVQQRVAGGHAGRLSLLLQSFGFKNGAPRDADMVFDVRFLPNPYWEPELRGLSGRDAAIVRYLEASDEVTGMSEDMSAFLLRWIPCFEREHRAYLTVAVGCTGGRHRSVYMVERLAERLREEYQSLLVRHRDLEP